MERIASVFEFDPRGFAVIRGDSGFGSFAVFRHDLVARVEPGRRSQRKYTGNPINTSPSPMLASFGFEMSVFTTIASDDTMNSSGATGYRGMEYWRETSVRLRNSINPIAISAKKIHSVYTTRVNNARNVPVATSTDDQIA